MAIPETQLETWSHQGSITQSSSTYATIKNVLEEVGSAYHDKNYKVFLQGSYGNDTNIYSESDVDVVIQLDSTFYYDIDDLPQEQKEAFQTALTNATYSWAQFKNDVLAHLSSKYSSAISSGEKAIKIAASGNRRNADVIAAAQFRRYYKYNSPSDQSYSEGICFFNSNGFRIANYPQQHSKNSTTKHQATNSWFKPMVRILKNMRSKLVSDGIIKNDLAPSYYIEGLLYNVPNDKFGKSYADTFVNAINWIDSVDKTKFVCANEQYYLLRKDALVCWDPDKGEEFIKSLINLWNNW
jgi:hypothetical protein